MSKEPTETIFAMIFILFCVPVGWALWLIPRDVMSSSELVFWGIFLSILIALFVFTHRYFRRVYCIHWFDLSETEPAGEMDWNDIKTLMKKDPLDFTWPESRSRKGVWFGIFRFPIKRLIRDLGIFISSSILLIGFGITGYDFSQDPNWSDLKDFGVVFGGLSIAVSLIAVFYNIRVKARSENRHKWIQSVREDLNHVIANFPEPYSHEWQIARARQEYSQVHSRLELYLNPSEKTHRALLALIRRFHGVVISLDREAVRELELRRYKIWQKKTHWVLLKSHTIRLANVVLKREWEQVKRLG